MKIRIEEVKELGISVLKKYGYNDEEANIIFATYLHAELTGKISHGLSSFHGITKKPKKRRR